ncbi:hypothetical protein ALC60_02580 [Trachymyrmex zeteki]|nr:hypothetical protein ALC60_02580 [Trachymyrmex zeteki]
MDTRNKIPPNDPGIENYDLKAKEPVTKELELRMIEQAIFERERKLKSREAEYEQRAEKLENDMCMLDRERERLAKIEEEKAWQDSRNFASNTSRETRPQPPESHITSIRRNYHTDDAPAPKVMFREATDSVPYFDGYNIPLAQFTRACRRAREIIPISAERNLTKLLINKLGRRAYYAVEDEPCNSVTELIDLLTDAFGPAKTLDQYRGELSIIFLKSGEHILDYISRVKDLRTAILDAERRERGEIDPRFVIEIDNLTARSFYEAGILPLEYRLQISPGVRHTDAFAIAKNIAKRAELDKQRLRNDRDTKQTVPTGKPLAHSTPSRPNYSGRTNYSRDLSGTTDRNREPPRNSYNRDNDYRQPRYEPRRETPNRYPERENRDRDLTRDRDRHQNRAEVPTCSYCKNYGHTINECRKRQYHNSQREAPGNLPRRTPGGQTKEFKDSKSDRNGGERNENTREEKPASQS